MPRTRSLILLLFIALVILIIRLGFAGVYAESWDAVDFALAMNRYDIFAFQPHFPGYPLYILAAHLFLPFAGDPVEALSLLAVWFGAFSVIPFYVLAAKMLAERPAVWAAVLLFAANPLLALTGVQPMSDALGLFAVLVYFALLACSLPMQGKRLFLLTCLATVWLALLLGIRLSYAPIGFLLLHPWYRLYREHGRIDHWLFQTITLGVLFLLALGAWLIPTAATEGGLVPFLKLGEAFTIGHFTEWGGTSFTTQTSWWERIRGLFGERLIKNGLLGLSALTDGASLPFWLVLLLVGILLVFGLSAGTSLLRKQKDFPLAWFVTLAIVPYALWAFLGQNSEKARHILPLVPWLLLLLGYGFSRWLKGMTAKLVPLALLGALLAILSFRQADVLRQHLAIPPALALAQHMGGHYPSVGTIVYTWEEQRLFDFYAPAYETERVMHYAYFLQSLQLHAGSVSHVLITNAVLDGFGPLLRPYVKEVARFTADPFLYPTYHTVVLYELPMQVVQQLADGTLRLETWPGRSNG